MMVEYEPIPTELGIIRGRDGICLDDVKHSFSPNQLTFIGVVNGKLCTSNHSGHRRFSYELIFNQIQAYECREKDQTENLDTY